MNSHCPSGVLDADADHRFFNHRVNVLQLALSQVGGARVQRLEHSVNRGSQQLLLIDRLEVASLDAVKDFADHLFADFGLTRLAVAVAPGGACLALERKIAVERLGTTNDVELDRVGAFPVQFRTIEDLLDPLAGDGLESVQADEHVPRA